MTRKSRLVIPILIVLAFVITIIVILRARGGDKLSEESAKPAAEKIASPNLLQPTPPPPDIAAAQEIIESDPDIAAYMKRSSDRFEVVLRLENSICLRQSKFDGKAILEFGFAVDFEKRKATFLGNNRGNRSISAAYQALEAVLKQEELMNLILRSESDHYFLLGIVAGDNISRYTVMFEEYIGTDFDDYGKMISQRFFDIDLEKDTIIETDAPS